jgi:hypothetical protein
MKKWFKKIYIPCYELNQIQIMKAAIQNIHSYALGADVVLKENIFEIKLLPESGKQNLEKFERI